MVGSTSSFSQEGGFFIAFGLENSGGIGNGVATVEATGFGSTVVNLSSAGTTAVMELSRNGELLEYNFDLDIYPIFTQYACSACHTPGGFAVGTTTISYGYDSSAPQATMAIHADAADNPGGIDPEFDFVGPSNQEWGIGLYSDGTCATPPGGALVPCMEEDTPTVPVGWRFGYPSIYDATPEEVYFMLSRGLTPSDYDDQAALDAKFICELDTNGELLTLNGGTVIDADASTKENARICTNAPEKSLLVDRPLSTSADSGYDLVHPQDNLPSMDTPAVRAIIGWIEQGARREVLAP